MGALSMDAPAAPAALDAPTRQKLAGFIEEACGVHVDSDEETDERAVSPPLAQLQMGCGPSGPSSYANEQEAMLVWATNWGLLSKPTNLPSWFSQQDMETIYRIGAPWAKPFGAKRLAGQVHFRETTLHLNSAAESFRTCVSSLKQDRNWATSTVIRRGSTSFISIHTQPGRLKYWWRWSVA